MADTLSAADTSAGPTVQRGGEVFIKDSGGNLYTADHASAEKLLSQGGYYPATAGDVAARDEQKAIEAQGTPGAIASTVGKNFAAGAAAPFIDAAQSIPKMARFFGLDEDAAGVFADIMGQDHERARALAKAFTEHYLQDTSPFGTMENIAYLNAEAQGQSGGEAAREFKENTALQNEANPFTAATAGLAGSTLATAPLAPAMALEGAAATLGNRALTGAADWMLNVGAHQGQTDAYFGNPGDAADNIIAAEGLAALGGAAFGALGHGASKLLGRSGKAVLPEVAAPEAEMAAGKVAAPSEVFEGVAPKRAALPKRGAIRRIAEDETLKFMGFRGSDLSRLGGDLGERMEARSDIVKAVHEFRLPNGESPWHADIATMANRLDQATDVMSEKLADIRGRLVAATHANPTLRLDLTPAKAQIQRELIAPAMGGSPAAAAQVAPLAEELAALDKLGPSPDLGRLLEFQKSVKNAVWQGDKNASHAVPGLDKFEQILEKHIEAWTDRMAVEAPHVLKRGEYLETKALFRGLKEGARVAGRTAIQGRGGFSLADRMLGYAVGAQFGSVVFGIASGLASKVASDASPFVIATGANKLANAIEGRVAGSFASLAGKASAEAPRAVQDASSAARRALGHAATKGAQAGAKGGSALALFMGRAKSPQDAYRRRVADLELAGADMGSSIREHAIPKLAGRYPPEVGAQVMARSLQVANYLRERAPVRLINMGSMMPLSSRQSVAMPDLAKFAKQWATARDPLSVLADVERGTISPVQVQTLQDLYPGVLSNIREHALEFIREHDAKGKPVSLSVRVTLNTLLGLGGAGIPAFTTDFALRYREAVSQVAPEGGQNQKSQAPGQPVKLTTPTTTSEQLESR